jgi:DNA mismatch repair protein MutS
MPPEGTPVMKQYQSIKEKHPDAVVLFRMGDFYEMFGEDARVASRVLQIALTTREKNKDDPMPMCGIPYFASENYIAKLIRAGHKVAVCEQVEDPRSARGIVRREVVRVISPGTHTPEHPKENAYIVSLVPEGDRHGLAVADVSTGEFFVYESTRPLEDELSRYEPAEVVLPESLGEDMHYSEILDGLYVTTVEDHAFDYPRAMRTLLGHFKVASLEGFGCEGLTAAVRAAGGLMSYLEETQKGALHFGTLSTLTPSGTMFLDTPTQRNLELVRNLKDGSTEATLLSTLEQTLTPMGGRFLRAAILRPLVETEEIHERHRAVAVLVEDYDILERLRRRLRNVQDVERLAQRISTGSATARDLAALGNSLAPLPEIRESLLGSGDPLLCSLGEGLPLFEELTDLIGRAIVEHPPASVRDGGIIRAGFSAEIDELRNISTGTRDFIAALEAEERVKTGITTLKVGFNRIHGYYIEVTKSNLDLVPYHYVRKQTLVGGERFITPELKDYESKVLGAEERLKVLELDVFTGLLAQAARWSPALSEAARALAVADFLVSLAVVAKRHDYVMPRMTEEPVIRISNGRHAVIERLSLGEKFIPNDAHLDGGDERLLVITGPNMAGKSTYMRQVALIVLMAQMGSFVPAEEAVLGVADRIFTRIGASDFLSRGQSTFMVEMVETANILNNATQRSLILLDEVGRGTSTFDGISIAWAAAEHISQRVRARTLFATHYNELTDLAHLLEGVRNYNIAVKEWGDEIIFLRRIEAGPADKSYGIQVARLAGLPPEVVARAGEVLSLLEKQPKGEAARRARQMDLFAPREDLLLDELLGMDLEALSPEEVVARIRDIKVRSPRRS